MSNLHVVSALREIRNHVEAQIAEYGAKVRSARAELDALNATIELFETQYDRTIVEFHTPAPRNECSRRAAELSVEGPEAQRAVIGRH